MRMFVIKYSYKLTNIAVLINLDTRIYYKIFFLKTSNTVVITSTNDTTFNLYF